MHPLSIHSRSPLRPKLNVPFSIILSVSVLLVRLVLAPVHLIQLCPLPPRERPGSMSAAIPEPDRWCPVSTAGPKSSLPPWIFHLWILQNQCPVFAVADRVHGSAFSLTAPHLFLFLCVYLCVCVYLSFIRPFSFWSAQIITSASLLLFLCHLYI